MTAVEPWVTEIISMSSINFILGEKREDTIEVLNVKKVNGSPGTIDLRDDENVTITEIGSGKTWNTGTQPADSITSSIGQKNIKVAYKRNNYDNVEKEFTVTVNAQSLSVVPPTKVDYLIGEDLVLTGAKVTAKGKNGVDEQPVDITPSMISGYNKNQLRTQQVIVTYAGSRGTFTVSVKEVEVSVISVKTQPKLSYFKGEALNLTGGVLKVSYNNGTSRMVAMNDAGVTVSGYNKNTVGTQPVTISYGGKSTTITLTVLNPDKIQIKPVQAAFVQRTETGKGAKQTPTGKSAKLFVKNNGSNAKNTREAYLTFDLSSLKTILDEAGLEIKSATLKYTADMDRVESDAKKRVLSLREIDKEKVAWTNWKDRPEMTRNLHMQTLTGTKPVTLVQDVTKYLKTKLSGDSATFGLAAEASNGNTMFNIQLGDSMPELVIATRSPRTVRAIELVQKPSRTEYSKGERLSLVAGILKVTNSDGATEEMALPLIDEGLSFSYDPHKIGVQDVTITYFGVEQKKAFTVIVRESEKYITGIRITENSLKNLKVNYKRNESISFAGGYIVICYSDGSKSKEITMNPRTPNGVSKGTTKAMNRKGDQIVIVKYTDPNTGEVFSTRYTIKVS